MMRILLILLTCLPVIVFAQFDCDAIEGGYDEYDKTYSFNTPISSVNTDTTYGPIVIYNVTVHKIIVKGVPRYYLSLSTGISSPDYEGRGATVLFENGKRITRSNLEVDCNYRSSGFSYSVFFAISIFELNLLTSSKMKGFKLDYRTEEDIPNRDILPDAVKCLIKRKK